MFDRDSVLRNYLRKYASKDLGIPQSIINYGMGLVSPDRVSVNSLPDTPMKDAFISKTHQYKRFATGRVKKAKPKYKLEFEVDRAVAEKGSRRKLGGIMYNRGIIGRPIRGKFRKIIGNQSAREQIETGAAVEAYNCAYVAHSSHPKAMVVKHLALAAIQQYCKDAKITHRYFTEKICRPDSSGPTAGSVLDCRVQFSSGSGAGVAQQVSATNTDTWEGFAIKVANMLTEYLSNGTDYHLMYILFQGQIPSSTASIFSFPHIVYNGDELMITLVGKSILQLQNQTPGGDQGEAADDSVLAIDVNPLRGKMYEINGDRICPKDTTLGTSLEQWTSGIYGQLKFYDQATASDPWPAAYKPFITKPPIANFWAHCTKSRYVNLVPGQVRKDVLSHTVTKSLKGWLRSMADVLAAQTSPNTTLTDLSTSYVERCPFTRTHLFALEKMCDTSVATTNQIKVGFEIVLNMSSYTRVKRKFLIQPLRTAKIS